MLRAAHEDPRGAVKSVHAIKLLNCLAQPNRSGFDKIDRTRLQELAFQGITDEVKGLRPLVWRVLLNYLPLERAQWDETLRSQLESYKSYVEDLIAKPKLAFQRHEAA